MRRLVRRFFVGLQGNRFTEQIGEEGRHPCALKWCSVPYVCREISSRTCTVQLGRALLVWNPGTNCIGLHVSPPKTQNLPYLSSGLSCDRKMRNVLLTGMGGTSAAVWSLEGPATFRKALCNNERAQCNATAHGKMFAICCLLFATSTPYQAKLSASVRLAGASPTWRGNVGELGRVASTLHVRLQANKNASRGQLRRRCLHVLPSAAAYISDAFRGFKFVQEVETFVYNVQPRRLILFLLEAQSKPTLAKEPD